MRSPGKSLPHFKLEEALKKEGCAVCRLIEDAAHSYLDNLLYELVNDPSVQQELRDSLGLCNRHAYQMLEFGDGLGTAILYRVVVEEELARLDKLSKKGRPSSGLSSLLGRGDADGSLPEPGAGCMVCRAEEEAEERYLQVLLEGARDGSLKGLLDGPGAVCIRHLGRAAEQAGGSLPRALQERARAELVDLKNGLEKYVRHKDYRFKDEPWGKERDSWRRAVSRMVGRKQE